MLLYFVRHGQTDDNLRGIIQGQLDTPLNDHGRREARRLAKALESEVFASCLSSDLSRASETAEILAHPHVDLKVETHDGLRERHLGSLQGRKWHKGHGLPDDVESSPDFRARITSWLNGFLKTQAPNRQNDIDTDRKILIVSHGAYLSTLLSLLSLPPFNFSIAKHVDLRKQCLNTSIMRVRCTWKGAGEPWTGVVESWGDVAHLDGLWENDLQIADNVSG